MSVRGEALTNSSRITRPRQKQSKAERVQCWHFSTLRVGCFPDSKRGSKKGSTKVSAFKASAGSTLKQHVSEDGLWRVRQCKHEEAKAVAALQASAFYEPLPIPGLFNRFLQLGFEAEILPGIRQKIAYSSQEGFVCFVAEDAQKPEGIVGVVEVGIQAGKAELRALQEQGLEELVYAYVSCMAVKTEHRRKGIASALLKAAEIQAGKWKQNWVLLHVYADNSSGVGLYKNTGYSLIFQDPAWQRFFGRRQRMLLAKGAAATGAAGAIMSLSENVMKLWQQQENTSPAAVDH